MSRGSDFANQTSEKAKCILSSKLIEFIRILELISAYYEKEFYTQKIETIFIILIKFYEII